MNVTQNTRNGIAALSALALSIVAIVLVINMLAFIGTSLVRLAICAALVTAVIWVGNRLVKKFRHA